MVSEMYEPFGGAGAEKRVGCGRLGAPNSNYFPTGRPAGCPKPNPIPIPNPNLRRGRFSNRLEIAHTPHGPPIRCVCAVLGFSAFGFWA